MRISSLYSFNEAIGLPIGHIDAPLRDTAAWIRDFISQPHKELLRNGPVCPHTPAAIRADTLYFRHVFADILSPEAIEFACRHVVEWYDEISPPLLSQPRRNLEHALMVVFTAANLDEIYQLVEQSQHKFKSEYLMLGHLLGKFHPELRTWSFKNPEFIVSQSPHAMFATRRLVPGDLKFLQLCKATNEERLGYLQVFQQQIEMDCPEHIMQATLQTIDKVQRDINESTVK